MDNVKVAIIGAAGRMGRRLVANVMASNTLELAGAVEAPGSPFIGQDAGTLAGCGEAGVKITGSLTEALSVGFSLSKHWTAWIYS